MASLSPLPHFSPEDQAAALRQGKQAAMAQKETPSEDPTRGGVSMRMAGQALNMGIQGTFGEYVNTPQGMKDAHIFGRKIEEGPFAYFAGAPEDTSTKSTAGGAA